MPKSGLRRIIRRINIRCNIISFTLRKFFLGFEAALKYLEQADKSSLQAILRRFGAAIGRDCDIESGIVFHNCRDFSNLIIGNNCHIGKNCFFDLRDKVIIENNSVISMQVTFITHIDLHQSPISSKINASSAPVRIMEGTYIGSRAQILMGITLGKECFVAAGAVVKDNFTDFSFIGGVPARLIKHVYDE